ncbi:unnamed protein product [Allacma fusca]|uniref:Uncharacterized protein n=1 Tax=Allacma fusca TaxID=39272 RepID=A0A8J2PSN1_9HEXA|nr:unnamed protein product [Allacma fusca]
MHLFCQRTADFLEGFWLRVRRRVGESGSHHPSTNPSMDTSNEAGRVNTLPDASLHPLTESAPIRPPRSRRSHESGPVQMVVSPNPPDFRLDQALEQQRQILLRFRDLQSWLQRLTARVDGLQNRLLELQLAQDRHQEQLNVNQPQPPPQLQALIPVPPIQPVLQMQAVPTAQIHPVPEAQTQPPPESQSIPTVQEQFNHQQEQHQEQQDLLTEDEDENPPQRVQPCRQAKRTNPCYLRETVAFSGKKTPKK